MTLKSHASVIFPPRRGRLDAVAEGSETLPYRHRRLGDRSETATFNVYPKGHRCPP